MFGQLISPANLLPRKPPNTYEASVVKGTDGCTTGAGGPSVKQMVSRRTAEILP